VRCGSENRTGATEISTSFVVASLGADQEFTASATDGAGTETIASVKYTATDQAKPTVTVDPIPVGPYTKGQLVPVTCTFSDTGGSGLTSVTCGGTTSPATGNLRTVTVNVDTSTLGVGQVFRASATDAAGNDIIETFPYSVTDQAKPTVSAVLPAGPYTKGQVVPVTCTFTDAGGSGLKSVTCGGAPAYVWPGGGIMVMVDVMRMPDESFGWVPTPAIVAPIEFTLRSDDYARLGGHMDRVRPLADVLARERVRVSGWDAENPWPL
jgi:hypothetical protein